MLDAHEHHGFESSFGKMSDEIVERWANQDEETRHHQAWITRRGKKSCMVWGFPGLKDTRVEV